MYLRPARLARTARPSCTLAAPMCRVAATASPYSCSNSECSECRTQAQRQRRMHRLQSTLHAGIPGGWRSRHSPPTRPPPTATAPQPHLLYLLALLRDGGAEHLVERGDLAHAALRVLHLQGGSGWWRGGGGGVGAQSKRVRGEAAQDVAPAVAQPTSQCGSAAWGPGASPASLTAVPTNRLSNVLQGLLLFSSLAHAPPPPTHNTLASPGRSSPAALAAAPGSLPAAAPAPADAPRVLPAVGE